MPPSGLHNVLNAPVADLRAEFQPSDYLPSQDLDPIPLDRLPGNVLPLLPAHCLHARPLPPPDVLVHHDLAFVLRGHAQQLNTSATGKQGGVID